MDKKAQRLMELAEELKGVIEGHRHLNREKSRMPQIIDGERIKPNSFKINLSTPDSARITIVAYGKTIVADVVAISKLVLQGIILEIRSWCLENKLESV